MKKIISLLIITVLLSSCSVGKKNEITAPTDNNTENEITTPVENDTESEITAEEEDDIVNETMEEIEDIFNLLESEDVQ